MEENLRDQLIEHVASPQIRERLEQGLTLDKAINIAIQMGSCYITC